LISIRRARADDVEFLHELVNSEDVEPFLGGRAALDRDNLLREVERSAAEPRVFGRFLIEVDGERAGAMGFELANERSRIARLERLAVDPAFRGRRIADTAARLFQHYLFDQLGFHRLELEIYAFNERAVGHAERAGFVREGVKRRAYRRHGEWVDAVLFGLVRDDRLIHDYVFAHNECVRSGDWEPIRDWFTEDAELVFEGVPVGPFEGCEAIMAAYRERPPDDEVVIFGVDEQEGEIVARYGWLREPETQAGRMFVTPQEGKIRRLVVSFET
jgi:RimJ/RimL family protein N-acetyltransferase